MTGTTTIDAHELTADSMPACAGPDRPGPAIDRTGRRAVRG